VAPATSGSGFSIYVADRGVDNNTDPNENDGRIYEISIGSAPSPRPAPDVTRVAGTDRYATAAAVSRQVINPARGGTVYLANGLNFPDALAGAPAARRDGAPLLLVTAGSVPTATCVEIGRLDPIRIVVLGSEAVVSAATAATAARCSALAVTTQRLAGADRYATAAAVAASRFPAAKTIMLTNGQNFPDALSGSGAAARYGIPILLAQATRLPPATCQRIAASDPTRIYVLGSRAVISDAVASAAQGCSSAAPSVIRLGGADRFATSALINAWFFNSSNADRALVATGFNFPDALGAGPAGDPVYLTRPDDLPDPITHLIAVLDPSAINVVGGSSVVSDAVMRELSAT
jgi:putative cell wall-binding protein